MARLKLHQNQDTLFGNHKLDYVSLYIYNFSIVVDFSSEKYSGSTGHRNPWYQCSEDADDGTRSRNPLVMTQVL